MGTLTITSNTEYDPYSSYWADVPDVDLAAAEAALAGSTDWTVSVDPMDIRVATHFAHIEYRGQPSRLYLTASATAADAAAESVVRVLGRSPDSLS